MIRSGTALVMLAAHVAPAFGQAIVLAPLSQPIDSRQDLHIAPTIDPSIGDDVVVRHVLKIATDDPLVANGVVVEGPAQGIQTFSIETRRLEADQATLIVNGQELGSVFAEEDRVVFRATLDAYRTMRKSRTGEVIEDRSTSGVAVNASSYNAVTGESLVEVSVFNRFVFSGDVNPSTSSTGHRTNGPILLALGPGETASLDLFPTLPGAFGESDDVIVTVNARFVAADGIEVGTSSTSVSIAGFGTFKVRRRAGRLEVNGTEIGTVHPDAFDRLALRVELSLDRQGINPRTGETITIPASKVPGFKAGKELNDAINALVAKEYFDIVLRPDG